MPLLPSPLPQLLGGHAELCLSRLDGCDGAPALSWVSLAQRETAALIRGNSEGEREENRISINTTRNSLWNPNHGLHLCTYTSYLENTHRHTHTLAHTNIHTLLEYN